MRFTNRTCRRALAALFLTLVATPPAAHAAPPPPEHRADPSLTTYVHRAGPFTIGAYETLFKSAKVKPPRVRGAIVAMDARLVDRNGDVIPQSVVMLHHLVFTNGGKDDRRRDPQCPNRTTRERFYGTSEELRPLTLPPGYGYPTDPKDRWRAPLMVMHHRAGERTFYVEYRMTVDTRPTTPVRPYWLSVVTCSADPQWTVKGSGEKTAKRQRTFTLPAAGRIVAAGAHLHGGAQGITLAQPRCKQTLVRNEPFYAPEDDPLYKVRPLLHEPDPKTISWWQSATGWPVRKGEPLTVTADYDDTRAHTRVMAIEHIYVAPPTDNAPCGPPPQDAETLGAEFERPRMTPPQIGLTLARLGSDGKARPTTRVVDGQSRTVKGPVVNVFVRDFAYGPARLTIPLGAVVRWNFADPEIHDITVARGPEGFASPWLKDDKRYARRFTKPGTYLLHCSLHSAFMSQQVTVTREPPRRRAADRPRR